MNTGKHNKEPVEPEGLLTVILPLFSTRARPTLVTLVGLGSLIVVSVWLDHRAQAYIVDATTHATEQRDVAITELRNRVDSHDKRFDALSEKLDRIESGVNRTEGKVDTLTTQVNAHRR